MSVPSSPAPDVRRATLKGLVVGVSLLVGVWGSTLSAMNLPISWDSMVLVHQGSPALWLCLLLPALCSLIAAREASLDAKLAAERAQVEGLTDRVRRNELYRVFYDGTLEGVLVVDRRGKIIDSNPSAQMMFGASHSDLAGLPISELVPDHDDHDHDHSAQRVTSKGLPLGVEWHVMAQHRDGTTFPAELNIHRGLMGGKKSVLVYVLRDTAGITDRLRRANHFLAAVRDRALEEARSKDRFLAKMSYELRTPLNAVLGYTDMLVEDAHELSIDHVLPDLLRVQRGGRHMLAVIANVLEITRAEDADTRCLPEPLDVRHVMSDMEVAIRRHVYRRKNEFHIDISPQVTTVFADRILLRQVLLKLLDNACRYTLHGHITATVTRDDSSSTPHVLFVVCDTGTGMDAETLRVALAGTGGPRVEGKGLPLSAARVLADRMSGVLEGKSTPGEGTCFTLSLPELAPPNLSGPIFDLGTEGVG